MYAVSSIQGLRNVFRAARAFITPLVQCRNPEQAKLAGGGCRQTIDWPAVEAGPLKVGAARVKNLSMVPDSQSKMIK